MDTPRCLNIADRIDALLQVELGTGIDRQRMLSDALYARDVLLVCDAHRGHPLAALARDFRAAAAEVPVEAAAPTPAPAPDPMPPEPPPPSGWGGGSSRFMSSLLDAFRPSRLPPDDAEPPAPAEPPPRTRPWYSPSRWRR
jgi:hypothetical protein